MRIQGAVVLLIVAAAGTATWWGGNDEEANQVGGGGVETSAPSEMLTMQESPASRGFVLSGLWVDGLGVRSSFRRVLGPAFDARRLGAARRFAAEVGREAGAEGIGAAGVSPLADEGGSQLGRVRGLAQGVPFQGVGNVHSEPPSVEAVVDACPAEACGGGVDEARQRTRTLPDASPTGESRQGDTSASGLWRITFYSQFGDPYCPYPCDTTASGAKVAPGVAACSVHWPFGSRFAILVGGAVERVVVCLDRGSAVTSPQHLDVFFPTADEGWAWLADVGSWAEVEVLPR